MRPAGWLWAAGESFPLGLGGGLFAFVPLARALAKSYVGLRGTRVEKQRWSQQRGTKRWGAFVRHAHLPGLAESWSEPTAPTREGCFVSAQNINTGLNRRTNEFLCFLKVSPSVIVAMPGMCSRHLLPAGTVSRATSPGAGALLPRARPVAGGKKREKRL